jgi:hypothetical protein
LVSIKPAAAQLAICVRRIFLAYFEAVLFAMSTT